MSIINHKRDDVKTIFERICLFFHTLTLTFLRISGIIKYVVRRAYIGLCNFRGNARVDIGG